MPYWRVLVHLSCEAALQGSDVSEEFMKVTMSGVKKQFASPQAALTLGSAQLQPTFAGHQT